MEENGTVLDVPDGSARNDEEVVGTLVIQKDAMLTHRLLLGRTMMQTYLARARAINPTTEADVEECGRLIAAIKAEGEPLIESLAPFKAALNARLDMVRDIEKVFTVSVAKAQQAQARTDERYIAFQAVDIIKQKMNNAIDAIEREKERVAREALEKARKEQEARLARINANLDKLLVKAGSLAEQKAALEAQIENPDITIEEAEVIRARIESIETQLGNVQAKAAERQMEQAQTAAPVTVAVEQTKVAGVSSRVVWIPTVTNPKLLLQAVLSGTVPIAAVKWDVTAIKQYGNLQVKGQKGTPPNVPGVTWAAERTTSIR